MLGELNIGEDVFDMFITFNASEKIEFLSDALEFGAEAAILKQISKISEEITMKSSPIISSQDFMSSGHRLCVTTFEGELQLNSNSLKTIRNFVLKLMMDGLIVTHIDKKKSCYDMYRYFRAYKVIYHGDPISLS